MKDRSPTDELLGRIITCDQMGGWFSVRASIPAGHVGVPIRNGQVSGDIVPAGRHTVVGWRDLLFGRVSGIEIGVIGTGRVSTVLSLPRLESGTGELVDLWAQIGFAVVDPVRFCAAYLQEVRTATSAQVIEALASRVRSRMNEAAREFPATLAPGDAGAETLGRALLDVVRPVAATWGIDADEVCYLSVRRAEEARAYAEKLRRADVDVREAEINARIDDADRVAQWLELLDRMEEDHDLPSGVLLGVLEDLPEGQDIQSVIVARAKERIREMEEQAADRPKPNLEQAMERATVTEPPAVDYVEQDPWWFGYIEALKWASYLAYSGFVVLALVQPKFGDHAHVSQLVYLLAGIPFACVMFFSALHLDRKAAKIRAAQSIPHRAVAVAGGSLEQLDRIVRQQVALSLDHAVQALRETRQDVYRKSHSDSSLVDEALGVKRTADFAEALSRRVTQPSQGVPAYLTLPGLSLAEFSPLLDRDDALLGLAAEIDEEAGRLRQAVVVERARPDAMLGKLDWLLQELERTFSARPRWDGTGNTR